MDNEQKLNVLFLPAWYPNRNDSMLGLFVKRHAVAVSEFVNVSVLSIISDDEAKQLYEVETSTEEGFIEILIYVKKYKSSFGFLNNLINGYRYLIAHIAGWEILEQTNQKPDINHVHVLTRAGVMAFFFKIRYHIPFIITEHWSRYLPNHKGSYTGSIRKKVTEKVINASAAITTASKSLQKSMEAQGLHHSNWITIPNVIDTKMFSPNAEPKQNKPIRFTHISSFEEQSKNMSGILRAAKAIKDKGHDFELIMIGNGPDWDQTKEYAMELGLQNNIRFTGVIENTELVDEMSSCQFSVLFSHYETFAIVIPENLSLGIPVIATNVGGIPEVLPTKFGKLISPNDEDALADAMIYMINHCNEYDTDAMRNYVEENYSYYEVGKSFYKLYEAAL